MSIKRTGTTQRWSDLTIYNNTLYLVEVPASTLDQGIREQTLEVFNSVEKILLANGSGKEYLLMVTIYLPDLKDIDIFNQLWDNWLVAGTAPVRACVQVGLANAKFKVELQVVAAMKS